MEVHFANYFSGDIYDKFNPTLDIGRKLTEFFLDKTYGTDIEVIYIGVICKSPKFAGTPLEGTKYTKVGKKRRGDIGEPENNVLGYDIQLDFKKYSEIPDIRTIFPEDVLNSLDVISTIKQIKDFDLAKFKSDFEAFFKSVGWI